MHTFPNLVILLGATIESQKYSCRLYVIQATGAQHFDRLTVIGPF